MVEIGPSCPKFVLGFTRYEWTMAVGVLAGSAVVNRGRARRRLVLNLALSAGASWLARRGGAGLREQGVLPRNMRHGAAVGSAFGVPAAMAIALAACLEGGRGPHWESRITSATGLRMAYEVLFRIPIGTALSEEIIFRGALLGLFGRHHPRPQAAAASSLVFGLWHVMPTLARLRAVEPGGRPSRTMTVVWVAGSVLFTSVAGLLFAWLRYRASSMVAPWVVHSAVNAAGFAGGWLAVRLRRRGR